MFFNFEGSTKTLTYSEYVSLLNQGKVTDSKVTVSTVVIKIAGTYKDGATTYNYTLVVPNTEAQNNSLMDKLYASASTVKVVDAYETNPVYGFPHQLRALSVDGRFILLFHYPYARRRRETTKPLNSGSPKQNWKGPSRSVSTTLPAVMKKKKK